MFKENTKKQTSAHQDTQKNAYNKRNKTMFNETNPILNSIQFLPSQWLIKGRLTVNVMLPDLPLDC